MQILQCFEDAWYFLCSFPFFIFYWILSVLLISNHHNFIFVIMFIVTIIVTIILIFILTFVNVFIVINILITNISRVVIIVVVAVNKFINNVINVKSLLIYCLLFSILNTTFRRHLIQ